MKTLDEVIKGFECCQNVGCDKCPYKILFNDDTHVPCDQLEKDEDAFYYLNEYISEKRLWEADRKGYLDWIEQYKEAREKHQQAVIELKKNPPLTWDELKAMEGKPVWVEHHLFKGWRLVGWQGNDHMMNLVGPYSEQLPLFADGCGSDWNAYRKERE